MQLPEGDGGARRAGVAAHPALAATLAAGAGSTAAVDRSSRRSLVSPRNLACWFPAIVFLRQEDWQRVCTLADCFAQNCSPTTSNPRFPASRADNSRASDPRTLGSRPPGPTTAALATPAPGLTLHALLAALQDRAPNPSSSRSQSSERTESLVQPAEPPQQQHLQRLQQVGAGPRGEQGGTRAAAATGAPQDSRGTPDGNSRATSRPSTAVQNRSQRVGLHSAQVGPSAPPGPPATAAAVASVWAHPAAAAAAAAAATHRSAQALAAPPAAHLPAPTESNGAVALLLREWQGTGSSLEFELQPEHEAAQNGDAAGVAGVAAAAAEVARQQEGNKREEQQQRRPSQVGGHQQQGGSSGTDVSRALLLGSPASGVQQHSQQHTASPAVATWQICSPASAAGMLGEAQRTHGQLQGLAAHQPAALFLVMPQQSAASLAAAGRIIAGQPGGMGGFFTGAAAVAGRVQPAQVAACVPGHSRCSGVGRVWWGWIVVSWETAAVNSAACLPLRSA